MTVASLNWEKEKRLLKRADFSLCYTEGKKVYSRNFIAFVCEKQKKTVTSAETRVGMAVTKKVGNAVARNRLKRLIREYCRKNQMSLPLAADVVITPKKHISISSLVYKDVEKELLGLFKKNL